MKILLTGATGYIGKRLLPVLVKEGHQVICCVRDRSRFNPGPTLLNQVKVIEIDLLVPETLEAIPNDIDAAYYLVHSMSASRQYDQLEQQSAINFRGRLNETSARQVIFLSGITNDHQLSRHLSSRQMVEAELRKGAYSLTTFRAGIIIGSGSASFEIIRDLVEKLPIMITPKWLNTRCQPIGIRDVVKYLIKGLLNDDFYDKNYDIGGPDILTYKEMLLGFARIRGLKRTIITIPVMTPRLSSYWLYFVTSTSYRLAVALVDSMKVEVVCQPNDLSEITEITPLSYEETLKAAFDKIENSVIISSWKDSLVSGHMGTQFSEFIAVPKHGCFVDQRSKTCSNKSSTINKIWGIGGSNGWYYANFLWKLRGALDKMVGGVGLRRGRTNKHHLNAGDALDFWRVLFADKDHGRLLLFAEMRLPGEAWLEFRFQNNLLTQTATFRPKGLLGRLYWYAVYPFHGLIFNGLITYLVKDGNSNEDNSRIW
ncbi:SDR family oxidoreductase [Marinoscillum sp. MHG1-6]|uniref:SDR family oxidoreductase n=1 Tax=Marinoscillum sp. MHG1-6 TaxID=2959627 RepID=UPI0021570CBE|nr:SDR family oxidoreductase [Marinoscillum sp. MHG1-6]